MEKRKIAVIFGGMSPEHEVSLQSAGAVLCHIDVEKYEPVMLGITREGQWLRYSGPCAQVQTGGWQRESCAPALLSASRDKRGLWENRPDGLCFTPLDAAMPVLHGRFGEDGTVQGLLELAGIPIIGCGTLASALCMDKNLAHQVVRGIGVAVPDAVVLPASAPQSGFEEAAAKLGYPLFVKPVRAGSSFGISKVAGQEGLSGAVALAGRYDCEVLLEAAVEGFEVGCALMGRGEALFAGVVDEIELQDGFFDYDEKYSLAHSQIHLPARIGPELARRVQHTAKEIYRALGCGGFARVDLFVTPKEGLVFNEVNTIPGFTAHSRFPAMMRGAGLSFESLLARLIETAVAA